MRSLPRGIRLKAFSPILLVFNGGGGHFAFIHQGQHLHIAALKLCEFIQAVLQSMTMDHLGDFQASELLLQLLELFDQNFPFFGAPHLAWYHVWKIVFDWPIFAQMPENVTFWRISSPLMLGHSECWPGFLNAWLLQSVFEEYSLASQVSGLRCSSSYVMAF